MTDTQPDNMTHADLITEVNRLRALVSDLETRTVSANARNAGSTMSEAKLAASRANLANRPEGKRGGWKKGVPRKPKPAE